MIIDNNNKYIWITITIVVPIVVATYFRQTSGHCLCWIITNWSGSREVRSNIEFDVLL